MLQVKPKGRELLFCLCYHGLRNPKEAALRAGYPEADALQTAYRLLSQEHVRALLDSMDTPQDTGLIEEVRAGLRRIAFGTANDTISMLCAEDCTASRIGEADLFLISEIKRRDGAVEVKFHDRIRALKELSELARSQNGNNQLKSLYDALSDSAAAVTEPGREECGRDH